MFEHGLPNVLLANQVQKAVWDEVTHLVNVETEIPQVTCLIEDPTSTSGGGGISEVYS